MVLRKLNALLSLLISALLLGHAIFLSAWLFSGGTLANPVPALSWVLTWLMVLHALLCFVMMALAHKGVKKQPCNDYPRQNVPTYIQRITGILLLVLVGIHITGAFQNFQPQELHTIFQPLFFATALAHVSVSVSKALISLGIGNAKLISILDILMRILCGAVLIASAAGFLSYSSMGV